MKQNLKKWFKKKEKSEATEETASPHENYTAMNSNSLYSLPPGELVSIIFKFDQEVKNLNKELGISRDTLPGLKAELAKAMDQAVLYKTNNESLQSDCKKLAIDLNEAVTQLDLKQLQIDALQSQIISKDEAISSYTGKLQELEKQVLDLQMTGINFDAGEEIVRLKHKLEEAFKSNGEVNELKIKNKVLEAEIAKSVERVNEGKEQIRMWKDKAGLFENKRKEIEGILNKKIEEVEGFSADISKLQFLKESMETEIRAVKEGLSQKEIKLKKKIGKIENLQENNNELQQKLSVTKYELDCAKQKASEDLMALQEKTTQERLEKEKENNEKVEAFQLKIEEMNKKVVECTGVEAEMSSLRRTNKAQQDSLTSLLTEIHQKSIKINSLESEIISLTESLKKSNHKRELARSEILKLSQRAPPISPKPSETLIKLPPIISPKEVHLLNYIQKELEIIYKTLMKIISGCDGTSYQIKIVDFSSFEKMINNVVMQLHEQLEEISEEKLSVTTEPIRQNKGRTPIKLFSCMADQDEAPRLIPKPKRPQQTDDRLVLRRGSAN